VTGLLRGPLYSCIPGWFPLQVVLHPCILTKDTLVLRVVNLWVWLWRKFCFCFPAYLLVDMLQHGVSRHVTVILSHNLKTVSARKTIGKEVSILKVTVTFFLNFHQCSVKPQDGSYGVFVKESFARCHLKTPSSCSSSPKVRLNCFVSSSLLALCYFTKLKTGFYC